MRYWEVRVQTAREALEAVTELMTRLAGGVAVDDPATLQQGNSRGDWDYCDLPERDPAFITITAYFPVPEGEATSPDEAPVMGELTAGLARIRALGLAPVDEPQLSLVDEKDWAGAWKAYFHPFRVGRRLVVVPSWEEFHEQPGNIRLDLDPGVAFGTGTHPTTALCLEALEDAVSIGARLVDVGCGSGILAIAAAKLGAEPVMAMDIDPVAVQVAAANVAANGVERQVTVKQGELGTLVPAGPPGADLVVSNIIADVIIGLVDQVAARLVPGGLWLAGGIIEERLAEVEAAVVKGGFRLIGRRRAGGWVVVEARRSPTEAGGRSQ